MSDSLPGNGKMFTLHQLQKFNGEDAPMYIAHQKNIYEVTDCPHWRTGIHEFLHFPGQDLTNEISEAPHGEEVFRLNCVRFIGHLIDDSEPSEGSAVI